MSVIAKDNEFIKVVYDRVIPDDTTQRYIQQTVVFKPRFLTGKEVNQTSGQSHLQIIWKEEDFWEFIANLERSLHRQ